MIKEAQQLLLPLKQMKKGISKPAETVLTGKNDLMTEQSIDFIFGLLPTENNDFQNLPEEPLKIDGESIKIEPFEVSGHIFTNLSDHYGLSIELSSHQ